MDFVELVHYIRTSLFPRIILLLALPAVSILITYVFTTIRYRLAIPKHLSSSSKPLSPPNVPYNIPFLGHSLSFLAPYPGVFWTRLFKQHPRSTGCCTLMLGGQKTHVLFDPTAVQALFKARGPTRDRFNYQVMEASMGMSKADVRLFYNLEKPKTGEKDRDPRFATNELQYDYMLRTEKVNELTDTFIRKFGEELRSNEAPSNGQGPETALCVWLRDYMFKASVYAFIGEKMLEVYPELVKDFWDFDIAMLPLFFGLPRIMNPEHFKARDKVLAGMTRWQEASWEACQGQPADPDEVCWEPIYGSRLNRARQRHYIYKGFDSRSKASSDLGFVFGLSANAIPASCWMLLHILDPNGDKTVLPRVLAELETAKKGDGFDISALVSLPLFQSILQEILRLYTDVLVTRDVHADLVLPVDEGKRQIKFRKGDLIMAPSWLGGRDEGRWHDPPPDVFYAERFLQHDPRIGEEIFTTAGTAGKFFPFGGGKTICPGRVFAKQEVLGAVATVLLNYDIQWLGFLDGKGNETQKFPGLAKMFAGKGVMSREGDMKVLMRKRA